MIAHHLERAREWLHDECERADAPSISVALGQGDRVLWEEACGLADVASASAASPETAYQLASVTKPITATAVCLLVEQSLLELDTSIEDHLPFGLQSHVDAAPPSVRDVLRHRGGLGPHFECYYADEEVPRRSFAETIRRYGGVLTPPGERFVYSNLGYGLLGALIENVTNSPIADFVATEVFDPLSMSESWIGAPSRKPSRAATPHAMDGGPYPPYDIESHSSGFAWATAADLVRFGLAHAGGNSVVTPGTRAAMQGTASNDTENGYRYGLGWTIQNLGALRLLTHAGGNPGFSTLLTVVPDEGLAIAALANVTNSRLPRIVTRRLLADIGGIGDGDGAASWPDETERGSVSQTLLQSLAGVWSGIVLTDTEDVPLTIEIDANTIRGELGGQGQVDVLACSWGGSELMLVVPQQLRTSDALNRCPVLLIDFRPAHEQFSGAAVAMALSDQPDGIAPDERVGNALSHWCQLVRSKRTTRRRFRARSAL